MARTRAEVERARRSAGGASVSNTAVKVELATQLGLPATATFDEVRSAFLRVLGLAHCIPLAP